MAKRFKKPSAAEAVEYAASIGFKLDGEAFVDYYDSVGWVVGAGRKPMKNWQAAIRTWKRNQKADGTLQSTDSDRYMKEAISRIRTMQQYVRSNVPYQGGNPKDAMRRYWRGLRDKHGPKFIDELKQRLNG
jgi:hypothetical protein